MMTKRLLCLMAICAQFFLHHSGFAQAPDLGTASRFTLFTTIGAFTNKGTSTIYGDVGTNAGAYTGGGLTLYGDTFVANSVTLQASKDLDTAYAEVLAYTCDSTLSTPLGNGRVIYPGIVYCMTTAVALQGDLYLDAGNDTNAIFILKVNGALTTATGSNVIMLNGGSPDNVYWQVNGAFNLGIEATFKGNILAAGEINLLKDSELEGRALTTAGAIIQEDVMMIGYDDNGIALPIDLLEFYHKPLGDHHQLIWTTASEFNNDFFTLERSLDGIHFAEVARIQGAGHSNVILHYSVTDYHCFPGTSFYRLKQTDFDGQFTFSDVLVAKSLIEFDFNLFPNPFQKGTTIYLNSEQVFSNLELIVFDLLGKECARIPLLNMQNKLNTLDFKAGMYSYQIVDYYGILKSGRLIAQ